MRRLSSLLVVPFVLLLAAPRAAAQAETEPTVPAAAAVEPATRGPAVVAQGLPARPPQARTLRAHWHVYVAFAVTWTLLFGYALSLGRRFGRLEEEVQRLAGGNRAG